MAVVCKKILHRFPEKRHYLRVHLEQENAESAMRKAVDDRTLKINLDEEQEKANRTVELERIVERKKAHTVRIVPPVHRKGRIDKHIEQEKSGILPTGAVKMPMLVQTQITAYQIEQYKGDKRVAVVEFLAVMRHPSQISGRGKKRKDDKAETGARSRFAKGIERRGKDHEEQIGGYKPIILGQNHEGIAPHGGLYQLRPQNKPVKPQAGQTKEGEEQNLEKKSTDGAELGPDGKVAGYENKKVDAYIRKTLHREAQGIPLKIGIKNRSLRPPQGKNVGMRQNDEEHRDKAKQLYVGFALFLGRSGQTLVHRHRESPLIKRLASVTC